MIFSFFFIKIVIEVAYLEGVS